MWRAPKPTLFRRFQRTSQPCWAQKSWPRMSASSLLCGAAWAPSRPRPWPGQCGTSQSRGLVGTAVPDSRLLALPVGRAAAPVRQQLLFILADAGDLRLGDLEAPGHLKTGTSWTHPGVPAPGSSQPGTGHGKLLLATQLHGLSAAPGRGRKGGRGDPTVEAMRVGRGERSKEREYMGQGDRLVWRGRGAVQERLDQLGEGEVPWVGGEKAGLKGREEARLGGQWAGH